MVTNIKHSEIKSSKSVLSTIVIIFLLLSQVAMIAINDTKITNKTTLFQNNNTLSNRNVRDEGNYISAANRLSGIKPIIDTNVYNISFKESGLPSGVIWYLNLTNGQSFSSNMSTIRFIEPNGTYYYKILPVLGYTPSLTSGFFNISGSAYSRVIYFSNITYTLPSYNEHLYELPNEAAVSKYLEYPTQGTPIEVQDQYLNGFLYYGNSNISGDVSIMYFDIGNNVIYKLTNSLTPLYTQSGVDYDPQLIFSQYPYNEIWGYGSISKYGTFMSYWVLNITSGKLIQSNTTFLWDSCHVQVYYLGHDFLGVATSNNADTNAYLYIYNLSSISNYYLTSAGRTPITLGYFECNNLYWVNNLKNGSCNYFINVADSTPNGYTHIITVYWLNKNMYSLTDNQLKNGGMSTYLTHTYAFNGTFASPGYSGGAQGVGYNQSLGLFSIQAISNDQEIPNYETMVNFNAYGTIISSYNVTIGQNGYSDQYTFQNYVDYSNFMPIYDTLGHYLQNSSYPPMVGVYNYVSNTLTNLGINYINGLGNSDYFGYLYDQNLYCFGQYSLAPMNYGISWWGSMTNNSTVVWYYNSSLPITPHVDPITFSTNLSKMVYSYAINYTVSFKEIGLYSGTTWSIIVNSVKKSSTNDTILFSETNGSCYYTVLSLPGYRANSYSGKIVVNGSDANQSIVWNIITYPVTIIEHGITNGTMWSATLTGTAFNSQNINATLSSKNGTITFNEPNGTYTYTIHLPSGYQSSMLKGSIRVLGSSIITTIKVQRTQNYLLIEIIVIVVIIILTLICIFIMRRKKKKRGIKEWQGSIEKSNKK